MDAKICIVTGATDGIGKVTARELARQGATVIGIGRNPAKIEAVRREIGETAGSLEFLTADLSSQADIRRIADEFKSKYDRLHVLVNNAGALIMDHRQSVDGIEMTFALNHLGYFLLTNLLLDTIKVSAPARIVNVASSYHRNGKIDLDQIAQPATYDGFQVYGTSKLANIMFTYELGRRLAGTGVTVNACNPGFVNSNFQAAAGLNFRGNLTPEQGANTQLWLATAPELDGVTGKYYDSRQETRTIPVSHDENLARKLWDYSAELVGLVD